MPITWFPADYVWKLPMYSQQFRPNDELGYPRRTYKFYNGSSIYSFGYGLSYTTFNYTVLPTQKMVAKTLGVGQHCHNLHYNVSAYVPPCPAALVSELSCDNDTSIEVLVNNTGNLDGSNVVTLYSRPPSGRGLPKGVREGGADCQRQVRAQFVQESSSVRARACTS